MSIKKPWKNSPELIKKINNSINGMSNEKLYKQVEKTDKEIIPFLFNEEYKNYLDNANPNFGEGSRLLCQNLKDIEKKDFIIITVFNSDVEKEDLSKKIIQFIPFDKIFVQTSIPFLDSQNEFCIIDSIILIKDKKENAIYAHGIIKYVKNSERKQMISPKFYESELNLPLSSECEGVENMDYPGLNKNEIEHTAFIVSNKLRNLIRHISYKLTTHSYKDYFKYEQGKLIKKNIVYSSDVKSHKRHFWKDSGKFKIPELSNEEIIAKGYLIDELVFKNNELRQNIPYTIIGNFTKHNEKKKDNRKIDLFKKRIWRQEEKLFEILRDIFPNETIRRHDRKKLNGLELDFHIPRLRLAFEYDGEQHFDKELYEKLYGEGFDEQVKRDKLKNKLCRRKKIKLIRIKYDESLCKKLIVNKIKEETENAKG